jgi:hypothetical protein
VFRADLDRVPFLNMLVTFDAAQGWQQWSAVLLAGAARDRDAPNPQFN